MDIVTASPRPPTELPIGEGSLAEIYYKWFEALPASTPALQNEAFRTRYQVYCVEHQWEDAALHPDGLERDEFDSHSFQGILRQRVSGETAGTVRLVVHPHGSDQPSLPIHRVCRDPRLALLPLETTAELSRFAVSKSFRRRAGDGSYGQVYTSSELAADPRRVLPHITLGLLTVSLQLGIERGVQYCCAVMEPAMLRLVARMGFHFHELGPPIEFHGWRQPCYNTVVELIEGVERERPEIWDILTNCGRLRPMGRALPTIC